MAQQALTFDALKAQLARGSYAPVYIVHGEEGYYVDAIVDIFDAIVPPVDRDFNLYTLYAPQIVPEQILDVCRRFPMMADHQVVIVKEMQAVSADFCDKLKGYAEKPTPSTILLLSGRGAALKSKSIVTAVKAGGGVVFEAKRVDDRALPGVITQFLRDRNLNIEAKGLAMLRDYVGSDLSRLYNEIGKLTVALGSGATVTPEAIERNIGVSKDYNNFELVDALARKDALKVYKIADYFRKNPKNNPTILTVTQIFRFFSNLMIVWFTRDRSDNALMAALGFKWPRALQSYKEAMRYYNAYQTIEIISAIRRFDVRSKGFDSRTNEYDLFQELLFRILNASGDIRF